MKVITEPVTVSQINFTLLGTHDNGDLTYAYVYYNASAPDLSGATYLGNATATYSGPHAYSVNISKAMATGDDGYFIIAVNIATNGTDNHTIFMNGATDPITFGFTTAPNVTNSQANKSQKLTIQAADITLTSATIAAGNVGQGSTYNVLYAAKMKVLTEPVSVNNINFTLTGNHDNNDLTYVYIYFNASSPVISGATYLGNAVATFAAPHTYSVNISKAMAISDEGYFIVAANISPTATIGKTIRINGATDPVVFGFGTAPNITNNQTNSAGLKTIVSSFAKTNDVNKTAIENSFAVNGDKVNENKLTDNKISKLYPNPANSFFNFEITGKEQKNVKAQLTNRLGNVVALKNITINKGNNAFTMNVSSLINGMYYLVLVTDKGELIDRQQVIIQH
ncbi:MAG: T9SS type A sorting domain-containing protein [Chitinophagaceae bacterium]